MAQYAIYVLTQIPAKRWLILIVLLVAMIGGSWGYQYFTKIHMRKSTCRGWGVTCCLAAYIALILWSTICLRTPGTEYQANLSPLWSWYQGFLQGNDEIRWQIYFNILLFVPFGCLLHLRKPRPMSKIFLQGFLLSLIIELCQLVFKLGLFEWDDMLHNSLGCLLGGFAAKVLERVWNIHRLHKTSGRNVKE